MLTIGGYNLLDTPFTITRIDDEGAALKRFEELSVAGFDGVKLTRQSIGPKEILIEGVINMPTRAALDAKIDELKKNIYPELRTYLDRLYSGEVRRYDGTVSELFITREAGNENWANFSIKFIATKGTARSLTRRTLASGSGITAATHSFTAVNPGTYFADYILTITITAATGVTAITFRNVTTGKSVKVTAPLGVTTVVFNREKIEVTVGGTKRKFTGSFFPLIVGSNSLQIIRTGTSMTYGFTLVAYDRFL